jgi:lipopolysaccharide transport system ATP-binding protein
MNSYKMSDIVLRVENLYKQYRLGTVSSQTLTQDLNRWWARVRGKEDPYSKIGAINHLNSVDEEYVWALQDINFEVKQGEVLGIIGKNGAGKSTLLKILSQVTAPTKGNIKIKGRIVALLEVGTGFHPELTGRENIFLNGAILGMTKSEIRRKFDEIVEFAGVSKYIDTPVKRYSSGMYVRLAFAVAAHLEPEILIVDEVLAVGDAEFQKKCLGKMKDVAGEGRTVLFVSHNMGAVQSLCNSGILLQQGKIHYLGNIGEVLNKYVNNDEVVNEYVASKEKDDIFFNKIFFNKNKGIFFFSEEIEFIVEIISKKNILGITFGFAVINKFEQRVFSNIYPFECEPNSYKFSVKLPKKLLSPGQYKILVALDIPNQMLFDLLQSALSFQIVDEGGLFYKYSVHYGDIIVESNIKPIE